MGNWQTTNRITGEKRWWALAAVMLSMFFSALNQTTVTTAMPTIISDLQGFSLYAWVFTAFTLAVTATMPIYGKLSDVYGRKPFYVFGLVVFLIGSALSGRAQSMSMLIFARVIQGIGGGAMMSMPRATVGDIFNPRERGRWMGALMGIFGIATLIGPGVGGWITDHWGWRWVFYVNMPVALVALALVIYALPRVRTGQTYHLDWLGSLLLVSGLLPMLLGFTWAGTTYPWLSREILGLFALSAVLLTLFVWVERRSPEPIIHMDIFRNPVFSSTMVIGLFISMAMFGSMMFLPLFVQGALGMKAASSGYIMTPMMLSFIAGSVIAGQVMTRTGRYKILTLVGGLLTSAGAYLLTFLDASSTWEMVVRDMMVMGVGIGLIMPVLGTVVQNAFPYRMMGTVNATQQTANNIGGAIAAPILGSVVASRFSTELGKRLPAPLVQVMQNLPEDQQKVFADPQGLVSTFGQEAIKVKFQAFGPQGMALYDQFIQAVREALAAAMTPLFWMALTFAVAAFVASLFLKEIPLRQEDYYREDTARPDEREPLGSVGE
ncbi:MAG: MFS transporter [Clostridiales bacterium]|nr:MFS transporter [Clostridiales bacterium]MBT9259933.1 MFS transporter [Clostridiales bacterium]